MLATNAMCLLRVTSCTVFAVARDCRQAVQQAINQRLSYTSARNAVNLEWNRRATAGAAGINTGHDCRHRVAMQEMK